MNRLVRMISDCVKVKPKPAVLLGGFDSVIVLHHLSEKTTEQLWTYTYGFEGDKNEFEGARRVAEHYGTKHEEVLITSMLDIYREVLPHFLHPRYSLWIFAAIKKAAEDGRQTCYIGEGADEHFGGYWYKPRKPYVENWSGLLVWGIPNYEILFKIVNLHFEAPFTYLNWKETLPYYDSNQGKRFLRRAYKGILPDFVLSRKKTPATINWQLLWDRELHNEFPDANPNGADDIRKLLEIWTTREWLKTQLGGEL